MFIVNRVGRRKTCSAPNRKVKYKTCQILHLVFATRTLFALPNFLANSQCELHWNLRTKKKTITIYY